MISSSFCSNCGHDSHCGTRYVADIDRSGNEIEVCKYCGNYINNKSRVKYILSGAEDALIRYNKKFMKRKK